MAHVNTKQGKKITKKKKKNTKIKIKCVGGGGGPIFSICSVWSLTQCHSWNSLPWSHQQTFIIATFYRPPATTTSFYSTSSSLEKENPSSNMLGTPLSRGGWEARRAFGPSTHYRIAFCETRERPSLAFFIATNRIVLFKNCEEINHCVLKQYHLISCLKEIAHYKHLYTKKNLE